MKRILLVSFFRSPNLGDLMLSDMIARIAGADGAELVKYDFNSGHRVADVASRPAINVDASAAAAPKGSLPRRLISGAWPLLARVAGRAFTQRLHRLLTIRRRQKIWAALDAEAANCDLILLAGGNMLMDLSIYWPAQFFQYSELARRHQKPLHVKYVGVGPIRQAKNKELFRRALRHAEVISVRDEQSLEQCREIADANKISLTADPVFAMEADTLPGRLESMARLSEGRGLRVGLCLLSAECFRDEAQHADYMRALEKLAGEVMKTAGAAAELHLFSTESTDYAAVGQMESALRARAIQNVATRRIQSMEDVQAFYAQLDLLIGGRMHSVIFAHRLLLPHIGVIWHGKLSGFAKLTGAESRLFTVAQIAAQNETIARAAAELASNQLELLAMHTRNSKLSDLAGGVKVLPKSRANSFASQRLENEIAPLLQPIDPCEVGI